VTFSDAARARLPKAYGEAKQNTGLHSGHDAVARRALGLRGTTEMSVKTQPWHLPYEEATVNTSGDSGFDPLGELLEFVFDGDCKRKYLAVLWTGAIDDSADRTQQEVIISAALIGKREEWEDLRVDWRRRLDQDEIPYFKSSHCLGLWGPFSKYRDVVKYPKPVGRKIADKIQDDLDQIIHRCGLKGVGAIIPVPLYKRFQSDPIYSGVCSKDPYHWAVQTVWMQCTTAMQELGRGNVITFAHDDGDNFPVLHKLYKDYKKKNKNTSKRLADFIPLDDKTHSSIQAADVAASVTHHYAVEWINDPSETKLQRLNKTMYRISIWDERFARLILDNELKLKAEETM
jgi:hypothetical protein